MIFLALFYVALFLIIGYFCKWFQDGKQMKLEKEFYIKLKSFNLHPAEVEKLAKKKPKLFLLKNTSILVHPNISSALQEIFDYILAKYINSWYQGFSNNEDFVVEIKFFFHIICSEILNRLSKIDASALVTDKVLPAIVNHLDICYRVLDSYDGDANSLSSMQDILLQKLKPHLHVVMINRTEELAYLRCISKHIIPLITPDYLSHTDNKICFFLLRECLVGTVLLPVMDTLATPDIINTLLCLLKESSITTNTTVTDTSIASVPILHRYQQAWFDRLKCQKSHPKGVECFLRNERHLYNFLQFIKHIDSVPPISFFLLMDSITIQLLNPELNTNDKIHLLEDLLRLDELIKSADSHSDLNVLPGLHERVLEVIAQGHESVTQLINCEIWMENYNSICQYTETVYLAQYFESEFYLSTIYGDRQAEFVLDPRDKREKYSKYKLGNTLKNSLSFGLDDSVDYDLGDHDNIDSTSELDLSDQLWSEKMSLSDNLKELPDLSSMRVKIPSISQPFITKFKQDFHFTINTFRIDSDQLLFKVHRKYAEFYVLEQKLMEFHGNIGRSLPGKKPWDTKKLDFLDSCKFEFETYLMFLVNRPFLKNSQLLFRFLTIQSEFNANTPIDVNLGRFVKSVPMKLAKEKGQFLDQFLNSFHVSCERDSSHYINVTEANTNCKLPYESVTKSLIDNRMHMKMFWNNAGFLNVTCEDMMKQVCTFSSRFIFSFYDTVCDIYETITFSIEPFQILLKGLYHLRPLILKLVESYIGGIIKRGIERLCHEKIAVDIIHLIRDSVLITGYMRTNAEKAERRDQAVNCLRKMFPEWLSFIMASGGRNAVIRNIDRMFDCLQQPKLNKQLSYVLLDIVLVELFPELAVTTSPGR